MPSTIGGMVKWAMGTVLVTLVGVAILSRTPIWSKINKSA